MSFGFDAVVAPADAVAWRSAMKKAIVSLALALVAAVA